MGPTVTDANVVLGRINPQQPIGRNGHLDVEAARQSIEHHVARPLDLTVEEGAEAILTVANANMAGAIRLVSIERGHDPARFAYMPFGGGGALHVCAMMREVGVAKGLIPRYPGVSSALGCAIADMQHDMIQTINQPLDRLDVTRLLGIRNDLEDYGRQALATAGVPFESIRVQCELDMLYVGQTHTVSVPVTDALSGGEAAAVQAAIERAFAKSYTQQFGQVLDGVGKRVMNLRVTVTGIRKKFDLSALAPAATPVDAPRADRPVYTERKWQDTPVIDRLGLPVGSRVAGPAIFEQADTTVWLEPGFTAEVDSLGNLIVALIESTNPSPAESTA
jgi:N-methylhydantoinase A